MITQVGCPFRGKRVSSGVTVIQSTPPFPLQVVVPSQIFDNDKVMAALAYQVDPESVQLDNYTMFRPRKKSTVLSSR